MTRHLAARLSNWRTGATAWDSNPRLCVIIPMAGGVLAALIVPRLVAMTLHADLSQRSGQEAVQNRWPGIKAGCRFDGELTGRADAFRPAFRHVLLDTPDQYGSGDDS